MPTDDSTNSGPAPSPELPLNLHVDGSIGTVDLIRRLHSAGLQLRQGSDDRAVLTLAAPLRRCDDCQLDRGTRRCDIARAAVACPLFGELRIGVESRCAAFVAKVAS